MNNENIFKEIDNIKQQLIEKYNPEKIILFGSAAWGEGEINDIDLFIVKNNVPHFGADRIIELYNLLDSNLAVDYIVYKPDEVAERLSLGDPFIRKIFKEGKLLYGRS